MELNSNLSNDFMQIGYKETGLSFLLIFFQFFSRIGTMFTFFNGVGNDPFMKQS